MPSFLVVAALAGAALLHGADEPLTAAPVTTEAAPAAEAPAPPPAAAPQNDPAPATDTAPELEAPPEGDTEPLPEFKTGDVQEEKAVESAPDANAPAADAPSEEMVRPTEQTSRSGKRVAAFWFISTGK